MFAPIKSLGQNFLTDISVATDMVNNLSILDNDEIIEIGPGKGIVTCEILNKIKEKNVTLEAVEIDKRLAEQLQDDFKGNAKIKITQTNILEWFKSYEPRTDVKIIGSLPYYITSPILHGVVSMKQRPLICVFLIQKEVAEKIKSQKPASSYLSCFIQAFFDVKYLGKVSKDKFKPTPAVDGGIIVLTRKESDFDTQFIEKYEGFLHKAFSNPRKMLNKVFTKEDLKKGGIDPTLRAQNLDSEDWVSFYKVLNKK